VSADRVDRAIVRLHEERRRGVTLPWPGDPGELGNYVAWLLRQRRSEWPADPSPLGETARAVAVATLRLYGANDSMTEAEVLRLVLDVATGRRPRSGARAPEAA
jgi:hypothetical protein